MRWSLRLNARMFNLSDGYPAFGLNASDEYTSLDVEYAEKLGRGLVILKLLFGWLYVAIPHGFALYFRLIWSYILAFIAWWAVLFTGKYPETWHSFNVGTLRWATRISLYLGYMSDDYPPFSGKE
jgi:hypothetical protein